MDSEQDRTAPQTPAAGDDGTGRRARKSLIDRINDRLNRWAYGIPAEPEQPPAVTGPTPVVVAAASPIYPPGAAFRVLTDEETGERIVSLIDERDLAPTPFKREPDAVAFAVSEHERLTEALANKDVGLAGSEVLHIIPTKWGVACSVRLPKGKQISHLIEKLGNFESAWDAFENTVTVTPIPGETVRTILISRNDTDPLSQAGTTEPPKNATIRRPAPVGFDEAGNPVLINLLRTHVGIVGGNGSGKSSLLNNILMYLAGCRDAVVLLIDLQRSGSLRLWSPMAAKTAWTPEEAEQLLDAALAIAEFRAEKLGIDAETFVESDDPDADFTPDWQPTPTEPALVLVIDEASELALAGLMPKVLKLLRLGRKCAVTVILGNQRADQDTMGSASVRKEFTVKVAMRMDAPDVDMFLGKGMREAGWLADRLRMPGLFYLLAMTDLTGEAQAPRRCRTTKPEPATSKQVMRTYTDQRPHLDAASAAASPIALRTEAYHEAATAIGDRLAAKKITRIATDDLTQALGKRDIRTWGALTTDEVIALMRDHGEEPSSLRFGDDGKKNAYYTDQLRRLRPADLKDPNS